MYSLSEFGTQFTWALIFWNTAERTVRQIVAELIGGSTAESIAVAMDMGNRSVTAALEAATRQLKDDDIHSHLLHLISGIKILLNHRNYYIHGLSGINWIDDDTKNSIAQLHGFVIVLKGDGRLKSVTQEVSIAEITEFKNNCLNLSQYSRAIMNEMVEDDWELEGLLGLDPPTLHKPTWPSPRQNSPQYLQS